MIFLFCWRVSERLGDWDNGLLEKDSGSGLGTWVRMGWGTGFDRRNSRIPFYLKDLALFGIVRTSACFDRFAINWQWNWHGLLLENLALVSDCAVLWFFQTDEGAFDLFPRVNDFWHFIPIVFKHHAILITNCCSAKINFMFSLGFVIRGFLKIVVAWKFLFSKGEPTTFRWPQAVNPWTPISNSLNPTKMATVNPKAFPLANAQLTQQILDLVQQGTPSLRYR